MNSVMSKELDYKSYSTNHPQYKLRQVSPLSGGENVTMSVSGGQLTVFELNDGLSGVYNMSKSYIEFTVTVALVANAYINCIADTFPFFRSISLTGKNGQEIASITDLGVFLKMVMMYNVNEEEFKNLAMHDNNAGWGGLLQKNNGLGSANPYCYKSNNASADPINYSGPKHIIQSTLGGSLILNLRFPLGLIKETIFAMDKDICFNDVMRINIMWESYDKCVFSTVSPDPSTAALSSTSVPAISSLKLWMATETNLVLIDGAMSMVKSSGIELLIPFPRIDKLVSSGTSQTATSRYSISDGKRLQKIYYAMLPANNTLNDSYNNSNISATANTSKNITSFYVTCDGIRLSDVNLSVENQTDFLTIRHKLRNSYMTQPDQYYKNWTYLVDFTDNDALNTHNPVDPMNVEDGLSLENPKKIDFVDTMIVGNSNQHYLYTIIQRKLFISPNQGVMFV